MSNPLKSNLCIQQIIEQQVNETPDAVAVIHGRSTLSYHALNIQANRLAHWLQAQGMEADQLVGVFLERSPEMIIAILAILKAGGAYVPLDPAYPKERINYIIDDAGLSLIITQSQIKHALPDSQLSLFCIDSDWDSIKHLSKHTPQNQSNERNLAYVIYTSGSTGRPKGVLIEHRSLRNYIAVATDRFKISSADKVLQFSSLSFDTAAEEIYPVLSQGGQLILRTDEMLASPAQFLKTCADWDITVLDLPTSYWHRLCASMIENDLDLSSIRLLIIGGERAQQQSVVAWNRYLQSRKKEIRLWNTYGPTETTIVATMCEISNIVDDAAEIPIGQAIDKFQLYVLDESQNPVKQGDQGELYIGGIGLAREYLNRPDLTEQAFSLHTFDDAPAARLYKTGDIVYCDQQNDLVCIGRIDKQIKLAGFRIELGEIEFALNSHPEITQAVACVKEVESGENILVAFVVGKLSTEQANEELRQHLKNSLPYYMIPQSIIKLSSIPLTVNGKVDTQALLEMDVQVSRHETPFKKAQTETEKNLEPIWRETLERDQVIGIHDDFFTLGGHSLLAIKALVHINSRLKTDLSLTSFFEYPTIEQMAAHIDTKPAQSTHPELDPIPPRSITENLPLSFLQENIWVYERLEPNTTVHTVSQGFRLKGHLNIGALTKSINKIIQRHEVLRTGYGMQDDQPIQIISESLTLEIPVLDLSTKDKTEHDQIIQDTLQDEVNQPFNFPTGPLIRVRILSLAEDKHVLFVLVHHSVFDGWSLALFLREFELLYDAFVNNKPSPLPNINVQYADYAIWQRKLLQGEVLDKKLGYWRKKLKGERPTIIIPLDYPREIKKGSRGAIETLKLSKELVGSLSDIARKQQASSFMAFFAAFAILIHRYTAEKDITLGSLVAARPQPELENLIGYFANVLPFRTDLDPSSDFEQYLETVRTLCLEIYANQDVPYELLAQQFKRHLRNEVSQVNILLVHYKVSDRRLTLPGLESEPFDIYANSSHGDLTLYVDEADDGTLLVAEYKTNSFKADTMSRLLKNFEQLIKSIVDRPTTLIKNLQVLPPEEQKRRISWNNTQAPFPATCVHSLFEAQSNQTPNAIAAVFNGEAISYQDLNARSNQLAHYLQKLKIGPNKIVAICIAPSTEMLVGLLGILKSGGAYLPLDLSHPRERLSLLIKDTEASVTLTQSSLKDLLPTDHTKAISLDSDWKEISAYSDQNPEAGTGPNDLAYINYTSGSTGAPKGVMVPHSTVVNFVTSMARILEVSASDSFLSITRLSFDISVLELFLPLTIGAKTIIADRALALEPDKLAELCQTSNITVIQATPVTWRLLLAAKWRNPSVKVLSGGEAMPASLAQDLLERAKAVWNLYGPTETTVWSTAYRIQDADSPILIGRPIDNTSCHILDENMTPVPIGVKGELYIGGAGVTNGYLNNPQLSAEKFVADPDGHSKLFRTGDFARYHADGNIEYLGREDSQVKIRGIRIELGEIEAAICMQEGARQAIVSLAEQETGNQRLTAHVVLDAEQLSPTSLKKKLDEILPDYMVPQYIVSMENFPLTRAGKVDRKALPDPDTSSSEQFYPPISSTEKYLAIVWEQTLGVKADTVGLKDKFFELGGNSLLAIQMASRLTRELKIELSLRLLFESADLQDLAKRLDHIRQNDGEENQAEAMVVPLQIGDAEQVPLFCICGIDLYRYLANSLPDSQPVYAIFIPGENDAILNSRELALENFPSVEELASSYVEAIALYQPNGPMHIAGISFGGILAYEIAQQLRISGRDIKTLTLMDSFHSDCFTPRVFFMTMQNLFLGAKEMANKLSELIRPKPKTTHLDSSENEDLDSNSGWGIDEIRLFRSEAYEQAMDNYESKNYPNTTILFKASETKDSLTYKVKPDYGWSSSVSGDMSFYTVPGNHLDILRAPSVQLLADYLRPHLAGSKEKMDP